MTSQPMTYEVLMTPQVNDGRRLNYGKAKLREANYAGGKLLFQNVNQ